MISASTLPAHATAAPFVSKVADLRTPRRSTSTRQVLPRFRNVATGGKLAGMDGKMLAKDANKQPSLSMTRRPGRAVGMPRKGLTTALRINGFRRFGGIL